MKKRLDVSMRAGQIGNPERNADFPIVAKMSLRWPAVAILIAILRVHPIAPKMHPGKV